MSAAAAHAHDGHGPAVPFEPARPPITWLGVFSMMLTTASAIWIAAYLPKRAPLGPAIGLMAVSWALFAIEAMPRNVTGGTFRSAQAFCAALTIRSWPDGS